MAKKEENKVPVTISEDQNENGVNVEAKEMLLENGKKGTKVKFKDRVKVRLLKDTTYQKSGKEYSPAKVKADWLVKQGIAEYVKD